MTDTLPQDPTCPKCGGMAVTTAWHKTGWECPYSQRPFAAPEVGAIAEHLHRTCGTCGYAWREPTLDAAP